MCHVRTAIGRQAECESVFSVCLFREARCGGWRGEGGGYEIDPRGGQVAGLSEGRKGGMGKEGFVVHLKIKIKSTRTQNYSSEACV